MFHSVMRLDSISQAAFQLCPNKKKKKQAYASPQLYTTNVWDHMKHYWNSTILVQRRLDAI